MIKMMGAQVLSILRSRRGRRNLRALGKFVLVLALLITVYSFGFHALMALEGQQHTWLTGVYWTLTVMSTLGFGDITFHTDLGRAFSILVLLSGMIFMLVLLPFTFVEFFYEPWMRSREEARAPRRLPPEMRDHVLLTHHDPVTATLIRRLGKYERPYALIVGEVDDALRLHDMGVNVMLGDVDDPETWERARIHEAALVVSTGSDVANTNVAFTVRALASDVPIITTALDQASVDILELAGSSYVLRLDEMIGQSFARRTLGGNAKAHVIGEFDDLQIAEAMVSRTPLVGKTVEQAGIRTIVGATVVGVWERGRFQPAGPETVLTDHTVLVLAGSKQHMERYNETFGNEAVAAEPVVILGGGRVGRATARALARRNVDYRIVEPLPERIKDPDKYILGSAADLEVLERAGIRQTGTVIITPRDDDLNVYLTIYCRRLRPDVQILTRATQEPNVPTMHRAGADSVLSYASMGTTAIMNVLERSTMLMVAEGLNLFRVPVPRALAGRTIADTRIREDTGCRVVAIRTERGLEVVPSRSQELPADADIVLIGTAEGEDAFLKRHVRAA